jgi:hypothetical protein
MPSEDYESKRKLGKAKISHDDIISHKSRKRAPEIKQIIETMPIIETKPVIETKPIIEIL